jgi:Tfp pilus assembly protein PilV
MKRQPHFRKGFTLIETLTYMFCAVLLLGLAIQLIHTSLGISTEAKQQWQQDATLARLTRDLRRDLTHSLKSAYDNESGKLTVTLEDGTLVIWSFAKAGVEADDSTPRRRQITTEFREANESYILPERIRTEIVRPPNSSAFQLIVTSSNRYRKDRENSVQHAGDTTEHVKLIRIVHGYLNSEELNDDSANQSTSTQTSSSEKLQ